MGEEIDVVDEKSHLLAQISQGSDEPERPKAQLARQLTLTGGIALTVGTIVGSGIFVSPNGVLKETGSVGAALIVWFCCGLVTCMAALCICELGCAIPNAGGLYAFIFYIYGKLPAFMLVWTFDLLANPAGLAIIHLTLAEYFVSVFTSSPPDWAIKITAAISLVLLLLVNCASLRAMAQLQTFLMVVKIAGIGVILIAGVVYLGEGHTENIDNFFTNTTADPESVTFAFYQGLWAYSGWDTLFHAGEELQNTARILPLAIKIGMGMVILVYLAANTAYLSLLSASELINSDAIAKDATKVGLGTVAGTYIIPLIVVFACVGASNGSIFMLGRQVFAAGREGQFPRVFGLVHRKRQTPIPALCLPCILGLVIICLPTSQVSFLIEVSGFTSWIFYLLCIFGVLVLRYREPNLCRPYRTWLILPVFLTLVSIYLIIVPFIKQPIASSVVTAFILLAIPVYCLVVQRQCYAPEKMALLSDGLMSCSGLFCGVS